MIHVHYHFGTNQVRSELVHGEYHGQKFLLRCSVIQLGSGQYLTGIRYSIMMFISTLISTLTRHYSDGVVASIAHNLERKTPIRRLNEGCGNECLLEGIEGHEAILVEIEWGILGKEICQGSGYMGKILDESPIKTSMA